MTFPTITAAIEWLAKQGITTQGEMIAAGIRVREVRCGQKDLHP